MMKYFVKKKHKTVTIITPKKMRFDYFLFLNGRTHLPLERPLHDIRLVVRKLDQIYEFMFLLCVLAHFVLIFERQVGFR